MAILPMVDPPQLHHCGDSHFVPYQISGIMAANQVGRSRQLVIGNNNLVEEWRGKKKIQFSANR